MRVLAFAIMLAGITVVYAGADLSGMTVLGCGVFLIGLWVSTRVSER